VVLAAVLILSVLGTVLQSNLIPVQQILGSCWLIDGVPSKAQQQ